MQNVIFNDTYTMIHSVINRPLYIFAAYLLVIVVFALVYFFSPAGTFQNDLGFIESIYFSVITITTLGYGDIAPDSIYGMVSTSLEAIIGILIMGMFINSSWRRFSEAIEKRQKENIKASLYASNKNNLLAYYSYLNSVINDYKSITYELTTPLDKRNERKEYTPDFLFSDFQDMLNPSLRMKYAYDNSVIEIYYREEDNLVKELKYVLANFGLEEFGNIKANIILLLNIIHNSDFKDVLVPYANRTREDKIRELLTDLIKKFEDMPPEEYHRSNTLTPVIVLYQTIPLKMQYLNLLEDGFRDLQK